MSIIDLSKYKSFVFDCDGVVLNSNQIKTDAFYKVAKEYGSEFAEKLIRYHVKNGGVSRYKKFQYFLADIVGVNNREGELNRLLENFACEVKKGLMNCEIATGLEYLRELTRHANWLIVSGGDQAELRDVFQARNLDVYFDGGVFGSPDDKGLILKREMVFKNIKLPALFFGDSKYDYLVSSEAKIDFVFLHNWTEIQNWEKWVEKEGIVSIANFKSIFSQETI